MELKDLKLNRLLGKVNQDPSTQGSVSESAENNQKSNKDGKGYSNSRQVITGTVVTSCIVQSTNSGNRIEISSFFNFNDQAIQDESFVAYNNGYPVCIIDKDGIELNTPPGPPTFIPLLQVNGEATIDDLTVTVLGTYDFEVDNWFLYQFVQQPINYYGAIHYDGTSHIMPPGFTLNHSGVGVYELTHNFNTSVYAVNVTDWSEPGGPAAIITWTVDSYGANSFTALSFDDTGTPTNSSFFFTVFKQP